MAATMSRRRFLAGSGGIAGITLVAPIAARVGPAFGLAAPDPATRDRNRLVVIFLSGGNDGLNTVVPRGDVSGAPRLSVYRKVRPTLALDPSVTLPLDRVADAPHTLGLHPRLATVHRLYHDGRVAVVQGVDYPKHSYSHFTSTDIWHSGEPGRSPSSGWLGRHLDRAGLGDGELRGVALGSDLPLILRGQQVAGAAITSIAATRFGDGTGAEPDARHAAVRSLTTFPPTEPDRLAVGRVQAQTVGLVDTLRSTPSPPAAGTAIGDALITARTLLEHDLGVECVYVTHPGYDTHAAQGAAHDRLLTDLDAAIEAFWFGTQRGTPIGSLGPLRPDTAARTIVVVVSEFGRRIGENGGAGVAGTDHGAAAPVIAIGPPLDGGNPVALMPGLHGDHPDVGTPQLPADNLVQTTDLRRVYQAVLEGWLGDSDPHYGSLAPLPGLFVPTSVAAAQQGPPVAGTSAATAAGAGRRPALGPTTTEAPPLGEAASGASMAVPSAGDIHPARQRRAGARPPDPAPALHPVSVAAAAALNAAAAALLVRNGGLGQLKRLVVPARGTAEGDADADTTRDR